MSRAITLSRRTFLAAHMRYQARYQARQNEMLSSVIVIGCASALIFARQPLPF